MEQRDLSFFCITELTRRFTKMMTITNVHKGVLSVSPFICSFTFKGDGTS